MRNVVFYRDFQQFSGGHLKVWHYFNHVRHAPDHTPYIYFSKETVWDKSNPWLPLQGQALPSPQSVRPDVLFLAGLDWLMLDKDQRKRPSVPVINFIQNVRHAQPGDLRYPFLRHRAIRICVSEEVAEAITESRQVNGPVFAIPNGVDTEVFPESIEPSKKDLDLVIAACKQPELGRNLARRLEAPGRRIGLLTSHLLRPDYLSRVNRAKVTVFLPTAAEGLYLPPLEGMALGTIVVCPAHQGFRSIYQSGYNCFRPEYTPESIREAAEVALQLPLPQMYQMLDNAKRMVARHTLAEERKSFLGILENVPRLWRN
jgi:glycosyltransferase involved in cell wall biosynthesis